MPAPNTPVLLEFQRTDGDAGSRLTVHDPEPRRPENGLLFYFRVWQDSASAERHVQVPQAALRAFGEWLTKGVPGADGQGRKAEFPQGLSVTWEHGAPPLMKPAVWIHATRAPEMDLRLNPREVDQLRAVVVAAGRERRAQVMERHAREMRDVIAAELEEVKDAPTGPADEPDLHDDKHTAIDESRSPADTDNAGRSVSPTSSWTVIGEEGAAHWRVRSLTGGRVQINSVPAPGRPPHVETYTILEAHEAEQLRKALGPPAKTAPEASGAAQFPPATEAARERARSTWQWKEGTVRIRLGADDGAPKYGNFALATRDRDGRLQIEVWRGGSDVDNPTHHLAVPTDRGPLVRGYGAVLSDEDVEALRGLLGPSTRERELEALVQAGITSEQATGGTARDVIRGRDAKIAELQRLFDAREPLQEQIDRLADFILAEVPDEPSQSQGAVDTAIRLIRDLLDTSANLAEERDMLDADAAEKSDGFISHGNHLGFDAATRGVDLRSRALAEAQRVLGLTPPPAPDAAGAFSRSAIAEYRSAIETTATYLLTGPDPEERQRKAVEAASARARAVALEEGLAKGFVKGREAALEEVAREQATAKSPGLGEDVGEQGQL